MAVLGSCEECNVRLHQLDTQVGRLAEHVQRQSFQIQALLGRDVHTEDYKELKSKRKKHSIAPFF